MALKEILNIKNCSKSFKDFSLNNICFSLEKGYIMGLIGPNGSGKTTLLNIIMNLLKKDSGSITVFGLDHIKHEKEIKNKIGFVYDESPYMFNLSLKENAKLIAPFYTDWDDKLFNYYMERFNLNPKKKLNSLSKGMITKFSIAMALCHNAELIILDEPTSGLDPIFRREILDVFYDIIQDEKTSILISTHITSDLDKIADYITYIDYGNLIFSEPMDKVKDDFKIIKGSNKLLQEISTKDLIGLKKSKYGFEALTKNYNFFTNDSLVIENASIEDILFFYNRNKEVKNA